MKYGFFDDAKKEYVITTPDTPLPWINYLGCENFFSLISNTCGGYSFYKDAKLMRLTRYRYNNVPYDTNGHYYYIKDEDTIYNPGWQPTKTTLDSYRCRHGLGYSIFESTKNGIETSLTAFVPLKSTCEINWLTIKNTTTVTKKLSLFSFVEFCLWDAMDDMTNFQRNLSIGEVEVEGSSIYHKTEYRERRNHYAVYSVNHPVTAFETDRDTFTGFYGSLSNPKAVMEGKLNNTIANGWAPVGSHQIDITLEPGAQKSFIFTLAYIENDPSEKWESENIINKSPAHELLNRFQTDEQVRTALCDLKNYWDMLLSTYKISSSDDKLNRMVNIWNQYQCMVTFNMSRSASYYESGLGRGMGFRDSCQDLLGFVHLIPDRARERILDIAATQFENGSAYHQYQPLTKKGNTNMGTGFNDDPLWLVACVSAYLRETGDFTILEELVPFDNKDELKAPLLEHLNRSVQFTLTHLGPHGLPLIGRADWNDCLNLNCFSETPGESFQITGPSDGPVAESIFIAGMFVKYASELADIYDHLNQSEEANHLRTAVNEMTEHVLTDGWDGSHFLRAYDSFGNKVGSTECEEGKIYIEPQGFCVLAGIGVKNGCAQKALNSVKEQLDTKYGVVLLSPAYKTYHKELGEISSYPPGYKENGGIFCHNNPWISIAETVIGRGDRAFELYRKICPAYLEYISDVHRTEPYVYSQMIAGIEASRFGEAKNSWLTGTAAWTFVNISQYILGVYPTLDGLKIDPCIPSELEQLEITRKYRGATYHITVKNPDHHEKGIKTFFVNGTPIDGTIVPIVPGIDTYHITVTL